MSNEKDNDNPLNIKAGWFSEPNVEFVIKPDEKKMGIFERIRYIFNLFF